MKKEQHNLNSVADLKDMLGISTNSELAARLGKVPGAISNWEKKGVPKGVWKVAEEISRVGGNKKADHSLIVEAIIGLVEPLSEDQKGEAFAILAKHFQRRTVSK